jgi:hypothetical protein
MDIVGSFDGKGKYKGYKLVHLDVLDGRNDNGEVKVVQVGPGCALECVMVELTMAR